MFTVNNIIKIQSYFLKESIEHNNVFAFKDVGHIIIYNRNIAVKIPDDMYRLSLPKPPLYKAERMQSLCTKMPETPIPLTHKKKIYDTGYVFVAGQDHKVLLSVRDIYLFKGCKFITSPTYLNVWAVSDKIIVGVTALKTCF